MESEIFENYWNISIPVCQDSESAYKIIDFLSEFFSEGSEITTETLTDEITLVVTEKKELQCHNNFLKIALFGAFGPTEFLCI